MKSAPVFLMSRPGPSNNTKGFTIDWLVKGSLTKIGDILDRLTGRGWRPSSSLATSELVERMKALMDTEARTNGDNRKYVPHNVRLKMQWDKFSTDSVEALRKLENELLIAAVDHINDKHYFTYAPINIEVKPDYFTTGVILSLGFEKLEADDGEAAINVTIDGLKKDELFPAPVPQLSTGSLRLQFESGGKSVDRSIRMTEGQRISLGRTKENDVQIDDTSVSKAHASLLLTHEGGLLVADTGSTNGTFVRGERIPYGKAVNVAARDTILLGTVKIELAMNLETSAEPEKLPDTEAFKIGDLEFSTRIEAPSAESPIQKPAGRAGVPVKERDEFATNVAPAPPVSKLEK